MNVPIDQGIPVANPWYPMTAYKFPTCMMTTGEDNYNKGGRGRGICLTACVLSQSSLLVIGGPPTTQCIWQSLTMIEKEKLHTQESPTHKREKKNGDGVSNGKKQPPEVCGHSQVISTLDQNEGAGEGTMARLQNNLINDGRHCTPNAHQIAAIRWRCRVWRGKISEKRVVRRQKFCPRDKAIRSEISLVRKSSEF